jgi:hypothetical protein
MNRATPRRLPTDLAVRRSFVYAWETRALLARAYALYAAATIVAELLLLIVVGHRSRSADYALGIVEELVSLSFAVGITRFVLLGELTAGLGLFRVDRHFTRYLGVALVLVILGMAVVTPGLMLLGAGGDLGGQGPASLMAMIMTVAAAIALSPLMLALPASAIGDTRPIRALWEAGRGNSVRLFATMLLTLLPFLVIEGALLQFVPAASVDAAQPAPVTVGELVVTVIVDLTLPAQTIVCTMMLALCYDALVRGGGPSRR